MPTKLRIVVTGLAATYPFGGVFWDYLQYVLGFHQLGHDVLYIEDTGKWCYSPRHGTFVESGAENAALLGKHIEQLAPSLSDRWFYRDESGNCYGRAWAQVAEFCRTADLFLHISASCILRDEYLSARVVAFIDSDPMYTQIAFLGDQEPDDTTLSWWKEHHDVFFTFGENIGQPGCKVPTATIDWIPTRQPITLDRLTDGIGHDLRQRQVITTVASWEPTQDGPVWDGVQYAGKSVEFLRFLELPARSRLPLEVALSGPAPREQLTTAGWKVIDAYEISHDPWVYRNYLVSSLAECSVAKNAYAASRSGWFSCRSACYLALGIPVIVQDTGFDSIIPTGHGVLTFNTLDEAEAAIDDVQRDYERHTKAARSIARDYFAASDVLNRLLEHCQSASRG